ncbi:B3 domain-containing transcription factor VRN1 [Linum perenne]
MAEREEADAGGGMWFHKIGVPRFSLILWFKPFREGKLRLPKVFAKEHGAELANEVLLKLPNGAEWQVSVVRSGPKKIWFVKGWTEFAEFYSLKPTTFMLFELASHNRLNVIIFDTTATQINYTNKKAKASKHVHSPKTRDKPTLRSPQPHKLRRTNGMERTACSSKGQNRSRTPCGKTSSISTEEAGPLARAKAVFKSENPFFTVVMQPSYIGPGKRLHAPGKFFEENFTNHCGDVVLQLPDVGVWTVKYHVRDCGRCKRALFQRKSWNSFTRDNNIRVGDVCAFELVEGGTEPRLNVNIFRASQDATEPTTKAKTSKNSTSPQTKSGSTRKSLRHGHSNGNTVSCNSCFGSCKCLHLRPTILQNSGDTSLSKTPPSVLFRKHMKKGTRKMELRVGSQVWEVSVLRYEADEKNRRVERTYIRGGWCEFAKGNSLVAGDVCVFELIKGEQEEDNDDAAGAGRETTVQWKVETRAQEIKLHLLEILLLGIHFFSSPGAANSSGTGTMKAPGGDHLISRAEFEKNPAAYFQNQRNK